MTTKFLESFPKKMSLFEEPRRKMITIKEQSNTKVSSTGDIVCRPDATKSRGSQIKYENKLTYSSIINTKFSQMKDTPYHRWTEEKISRAENPNFVSPV